MAPYRIIKTKDVEALRKEVSSLKLEVKGFYESDNSHNEFLKRIQQYFRDIKLPPVVPMDQDAVVRAYKTIAPVNGIVDFIADNVAEVLQYLELRRLKEDGTYDYFPDHPVMQTLRHPNDRQNLKRFGKEWAVNRLLHDCAWVYAPKTKGKDRFVDPKIGMYVMPSNRVAVKCGGLFKPFVSIVYRGPDDKPIDIKDQVFESFGPSLDPTDPFGTSKIVAAAIYLSVIDKGMRRQDVALDNGGPAAIISPKPDNNGILPDQADQVEKEFNDKTAVNKFKAMRIPIEVNQLGSTPVDLSILEGHKEAVTALCFVFHISPDLYYGQAKYENAKEAKKTIYEQQAIPLAEEFAADYLHYLGLDGQGFELKVNVDEIAVLRESPTEVLDRIEKMYGTINERRTANGYDPIDEDWANQPVIPMGVSLGYESYDISETGNEEDD